jgi:cytochrome c-type biogenesis protein CcmF
MSADIGHFMLILAMAVSFLLAVLPLTGSLINHPAMMRMAKPLAYLTAACLTISFLALVSGFLNNNFTIAYVAQNSNTQLPVGYRIAATWGGHEGSLLLWVTILGVWLSAVAFLSEQLPRDMRARVLSVMGIIAFGFILFIEITSNPFERLLPGFPVEGKDLNPLLQDFGLVIHPPMLYMGYVGLSVVFAFTVAALIGGNMDTSWAKWSRPWTTAAWCFLTIGIALGSWWAYYELGWGGWWFWDPVENASFMPWLAGTALIHSLAATEKRGVFRLWTVLLSITAFSLSLLGTFLVRSGVLTSVHAFASDPSRGLFILVLLTVISGSALLLTALRAPMFRATASYKFFSREGFLLLNNLLVCGACVVVFIGTLFPLLTDVLDMGKFSVGPPYFNTLFVPLVLVLLLALGIGPWLHWREQKTNGLVRRSVVWAITSIILGAATNWLVAGSLDAMVWLTFALCYWVLCGEVYTLWLQVRNKQNKAQALGKSPAWLVGMVVAHVGLLVSVAGVAATSFYSIEKDAKLALNTPIEVAGKTFELQRLTDITGPNYVATRALIQVTDGEKQFLITPEKRLYIAQQMPMTEVAIRPSLNRELYVAMGEVLDDGSWAMRIHIRPLIRWIWLGAIFMALGGMISICDRRYRKVKSRASARSSIAGTAAA